MERAEAEAEAKAEILEAFDAICPGVVGNPFVPHWPFAKQQLFLGLHLQAREDDEEVFQALYGGAAGGGKSDTLLMAAAQYVQHPEYAAILFRRSHAEHKLPGALTDRAREWWEPAGAVWNGSDMMFRFPSGAKIAMGYMSKPGDELRYQSAAFQFTGWDELTHWPTAYQYNYVGYSRVRRLAGSQIPPRTLAGSNPGGPGHVWVQKKFVGGTDPLTGKPITPEHRFIPSRIDDNPFLDRALYIKSLMHLHPTLRAQLLNGDWSARDPGDYFRAEWFGPLLRPEEDTWQPTACRRIRWWDLAASEREHAKRTAGVKMARHVAGSYAIEHGRAFKATPGKRDDLIVQTAQADGKEVYVGIEIEPGSGGEAQFQALKKRLNAKGFRCVGARPRAQLTNAEGKIMSKASPGVKGKAARCDPVAAELQRGHVRRGECSQVDEYGNEYEEWGVDANTSIGRHRHGIRLFAGPWTQDYLDEVEGFPPESDAELCDYADATSGAWAWLWAHPAGTKIEGITEKPQPQGEQHNVHPEDRVPDMTGKDRAGRWRY